MTKRRKERKEDGRLKREEEDRLEVEGDVKRGRLG